MEQAGGKVNPTDAAGTHPEADWCSSHQSWLQSGTCTHLPDMRREVCVWECLDCTYRLRGGLWLHAFFADGQFERVLDARFQLRMRDSQHGIFFSQAEGQSGAVFWTLSARHTHTHTSLSYVTAVMKFKARTDRSPRNLNLAKQDI